jgi:hypothetical protein
MCAGVAKPIGMGRGVPWECHYHPGADDVRLPCLALTPLEVLDRIFLVIEPQLLASS